MKRTVFLVTWEINNIFNKVTKALFERAEFLRNEDYTVKILTMDLNLRYEEITQSFKEKGILHQDIQVLNIYEYYKNHYSNFERSLGNINNSNFEAKEQHETNVMESEAFIEKGDNYARYFINGIYQKYKKWDQDGNLHYIDYFDQNRVRVRREEFNKNEELLREIAYHPSNNKRNQERYFTLYGSCYYSIWFNHLNNKPIRFQLFNPENQNVEVFNKGEEMHVFWLNELCSSEEIKPIIINESSITASRVAGVNHELAYKIYVFNSSHIEELNKEDGNFKKDYIDGISEITKGYPTVVYTESQRLDLHKEVGNRGNIRVIPNFIRATTINSNNKNAFKCIAVFEKSSNRNIEELIVAFKKVLSEIPLAQLAIYTNEDEMINNLIMKEKVRDSISVYKLKELDDDVYQNSTLYLTMSPSESLDYDLLRAFANGVPAISYDINYGPKEVLMENETGVSVASGDEDAFIEQIIYLLNNQEFVKQLGNNAKQFVDDHFNKESYQIKWRELLAEVLSEEVFFIN